MVREIAPDPQQRPEPSPDAPALLLVAPEAKVAERVERLVRGELSGLSLPLQWSRSTPEAEGLLHRHGLVLALLDVALGDASMTRFLRVLRARRRASATLLLAEEHQEPIVLRGLAAGALDVVFHPEMESVLARSLRLAHEVARARGAARTAEERAEALFADSVAGTFRLDLNGTLEDCNSAFASLLGFPSAERLLESDVDPVAALRPGGRGEGDWLLDLAGPFARVCVLQRADGAPVTVKLRCRVVRDVHGAAQAVEGTLVDLSWLEGSLNPASPVALRRHPLWRLTGEGLLVLDRQARIEELNDAAERILGFERQALLGHTLLEAPLVVRRPSGEPWGPGQFPPAQALATDAPVSDVRCRLRTVDGERLARMNAVPVEPLGNTLAHRVLVALRLDSDAS